MPCRGRQGQRDERPSPGRLLRPPSPKGEGRTQCKNRRNEATILLKTKDSDKGQGEIAIEVRARADGSGGDESQNGLRPGPRRGKNPATAI